MKEDYYKISDLIYREFVGELSEEEKNFLNEWLSADERNREYYKKLFTSFSIEQVNKLSGIDTNTAWYKYNKKYQRRISFTTAIKYAAVVVFMLSVGGLIYINQKSESVKQPVVAEVISPGKPTAILKIEGKKDIKLGDNKDLDIQLQEGIKLKADSANISYDKNLNKQAKEKAVMHSLNIPKGGEFFLTLSDGTKVWVNSETKLRYPSYFDGNKRIVELDGEAYFEVSKNKKMPFIVKSGDTNVEVLGTQFNVNSYKDSENITTTLVEGKVKVSAKRGNKIDSFKLTPRMQSVYNKVSRKTKIRKNVDINIYTAWKRGFFMFQDKRLEDIMIDLSRWYGMEVFYEDAETKDMKFTGEFKRYEDFTYVLKFLKLTKKVVVRTKGKTIYIKSL